MGLLKQNYDKKYSLKTAKNIHNNPPPENTTTQNFTEF